MKFHSYLTIVRHMFCVVAIAIVANLSTAQAAISLGEAGEFTLLALEDGTMIINSATSITGDVGYSDGVVSNTNQKVDTFDGTVYIHSGASVTTTPATFAPTGGTMTGGAADAKLDQANSDAAAAASAINALVADYSLGVIGDNDDQDITRTGSMTVIDIASLNYKEDMFTLTGDISGADQFIIRVAGSFDWDASVVSLVNVDPLNVIWFFPNMSSVSINKAETVFKGIILAPTGDVEYHNPATFEGAIIAKDIDVHSDFNISGPSDTPEIPAPAALPAGLALIGLAMTRRRR